MSESDSLDNYSDSIAQRVLAVSTLLSTAADVKDAELRRVMVELVERVRLTIPLPAASLQGIDGGKGKRGANEPAP
jgi:hypothetical protein